MSNSIGDVGGSPPLAHGGGIGSETGMLTAVGSFAAVSSRASLIPLFFHTIGTTHCSALIPSSITYNLAQIHNMLGHGTAKLALSLRAAKTGGYTSTTLGSQAEEASAKIGASRELAIGSPLERTLNLPPYNVRGAGVGRSCQRARRLTPCASKFPQRMRTGAHDLAPSSSLSLSLSFFLSLSRERAKCTRDDGPPHRLHCAFAPLVLYQSLPPTYTYNTPFANYTVARGRYCLRRCFREFSFGEWYGFLLPLRLYRGL